MNNIDLLKYTRDKISLYKDFEWINENLCFLSLSGSRLYGTNSESSDYDIRGVCIAPKDYWIGSKKFEVLELKEDDNNIGITIYDYRKFLNLVGQNSPNVIELLFIKGPNLLLIEEYFDLLIPTIKTLINQESYKTYHAYGFSQIRKAEADAAKAKPSRKDLVQNFGYDTKFAMHAFRLLRQGFELITTGNITFPSPSCKDLIDIKNGKYKTIKEAREAWELESKIFNDSIQSIFISKKRDFKLLNILTMGGFNYSKDCIE